MADPTAFLRPPDYEAVPTVAELMHRGLAREQTRTTAAGKVETRATLSPAGQQLIYDAMKRNAARGRAWEAQRLVNAASDGNEL